MATFLVLSLCTSEPQSHCSRRIRYGQTTTVLWSLDWHQCPSRVPQHTSVHVHSCRPMCDRSTLRLLLASMAAVDLYTLRRLSLISCGTRLCHRLAWSHAPLKPVWSFDQICRRWMQVGQNSCLVHRSDQWWLDGTHSRTRTEWLTANQCCCSFTVAHLFVLCNIDAEPLAGSCTTATHQIGRTRKPWIRKSRPSKTAPLSLHNNHLPSPRPILILALGSGTPGGLFKVMLDCQIQWFLALFRGYLGVCTITNEHIDGLEGIFCHC